MARRWISSLLKALTATGTFCRFSSRLRAVTSTSSICALASPATASAIIADTNLVGCFFDVRNMLLTP
jgi:hypothetical protein